MVVFKKISKVLPSSTEQKQIGIPVGLWTEWEKRILKTREDRRGERSCLPLIIQGPASVVEVWEAQVT